MKQLYRVGILFSTTGPYALLGRDAFDGTMMALSEINEDRDGWFEVIPVVGDPGGVTDRYPAICEDLIQQGARHIVGGITSWSRKEMIPVVDRRNALLWYPCPYEGYECSDRVIYLGACPNQHIVPLFGIVAGRLASELGKPVVVIGFDAGVGRGSVRGLFSSARTTSGDGKPTASRANCSTIAAGRFWASATCRSAARMSNGSSPRSSRRDRISSSIT